MAKNVRDRLKSQPVIGHAYRVTIGVIGTLVVALGLLLVPFPGPGWLIVILGLLVLSTEFVWAQRLLGFVREQVRRWTDWMAAQSVVVRLGVALATAALVGAILYLTVLVFGLPDWVPGRLVPPLPGLEEYTDWD
jgi:uncharacterized protein (TIGR02611 family)